MKNESEIRSTLLDDDLSGIDLIWSHYGNELYAYLCGLLCSRHEAEDVLQEVFIKIARKRLQIAKSENIRGYLYRISRNEGLDWIRKQKRGVEIKMSESDWITVKEEEKEVHSGINNMERALSRLPEDQRIVVVMKTIQELTFREISESLEISENTTASRYRYGIEKMKQLLKGTSDEQD